MDKKSYARVAVNVPGVSDLFDYHIPPELTAEVVRGCLIEAPFGAQQVQGVVTDLIERPAVDRTKPLSSILDKEAVLTSVQLDLAFWLAERYFNPLPAVITSMLPPGLSQTTDTLYTLNLPDGFDLSELTELQQRIVRRIQEHGALRGRQLDAAFRHVNWRRSVNALLRRELLTRHGVLPESKVRSKTARSVLLDIPKEELPSALKQVGKAGSQASERRQKALNTLAASSEPLNVSYIYASSGANAADLRYMEKKGLIRFVHEEVMRDPLANVQAEHSVRPELTTGQQHVWQAIEKQMCDGTNKKPVLLHGVTGSGKTEIYMRAIEKTLASGKQAIVLVPEISLTPQTIQRFLARFPGKVGVVHSKLSPGERYDTWRRARAGDFSIVIGPRSALFTPFPKIGVIVLDECHEASYVQTETPYYHGVDAAIQYGQAIGALVILGSATPNVALYYRAERENWPLLRLPQRIFAHRADPRTGLNEGRGPELKSLPLPPVDVVDMREELKAGNSSIFSRVLREKIAEVLEAKQQAILLLNRRGSATYVFCRDCGESLKCPRCDMPLTYHRGGMLTCHTCGYQRKMPANCPVCQSRRIRQYGSGTEKVEELLNKDFPSACVLRWDADTTRGKGAEDVILSHFRQHNADILVGTQMLAKGLDLPLVTLVGVVLADAGLNFPDYRTAERAFQLLTQVAGRAGRSALGGSVVIQTFQPEHYAIHHAATHDFAGFYTQELEYRRELRYPPFVDMLRFEVRDQKNEAAQAQAERLKERLERLIAESRDRTLTLSGPVPPYFARQSGYYRWQVILKGMQPQRLLKEQTFPDVRIHLNPPNLL